ncbi:MAG: hypothetical protein Q3M24_02510 [Candidatus Electrothrix aestuarii]|uniref:NlpC/P60 family protein n=1 Tax=Candidatus Electrothrix aestuarii TaxID=3062594 RepID=A0AAU8LX98_9BACT|nr:hypothetical protein [Candidatus Electrothrix aestuarii]
MKLIKLLHLKSVWLVLLIASLLIGAFWGRKYSTRAEFPDESINVSPRPELARVEAEEDGESIFARQCRDVLYEMQYCMPSFPLPAAGKEEGHADSEQEVTTPQAIVSLRPLRKKQRIAPPEKSVQMDFSGHLSGDDQAAYTEGLLPAVRTTVASLEARSILYGVGPLSDCSGILHRVLMGVKKRCPDYEYPTPEHYRDSRDLARWYHERGELILIKNALAQAELIRPGVVLFYGRTGVVYRNPSVNTLLSSRHGIYHVGIVARVYRDKAGKVAGYELFHGHGRKGRTKASRTRWHQRTPTRAAYPPFGNGRQQLVAAARLVRPVDKGDVKKRGE